MLITRGNITRIGLHTIKDNVFPCVNTIHKTVALIHLIQNFFRSHGSIAVLDKPLLSKKHSI